MSRRRVLEPPTLLLGIALYGSWMLLTIAAAKLPLWVLIPCGGFLVAWHGSLQHETIHGHPTRSRRFNAIFGAIPLGLWLPYGIYRELHLAHHRTSELTDPLDDPESFYVTQREWQRVSSLRRALLWVNSTLIGRMTIGPFWVLAKFFASELDRVRRGDFRHLRAWATHLVGVALVVAWLELVCGLSVATYALAFVYPGLSLTLLRSFAEHRAAETNTTRTAIIEAGPLASLLFLNNNLHVVHHEAPALPWYELPARYRATRADVIARNGGYVFAGYSEVFRRFALRPKDAPVHPSR